MRETHEERGGTWKIFLVNLECVSQAPDHWKTDPSPGPGPRLLLPDSFSSCMISELFPFQQIFPQCLLSSSIASIRGMPLNTILLSPFGHFWRPRSFPQTGHRRHKRSGPFTRDFLRSHGEHCSASLLRKNFPTAPPSSRIPPHLCSFLPPCPTYSCFFFR